MPRIDDDYSAVERPGCAGQRGQEQEQRQDEAEGNQRYVSSRGLRICVRRRLVGLTPRRSPALMSVFVIACTERVPNCSTKPKAIANILPELGSKGTYMIRLLAGIPAWLSLVFRRGRRSGGRRRFAIARRQARSVGLRHARLARIDAAVAGSIERHQLPGVVVLIIREGKVAFRHAYGSRSLQPSLTPMTVDTVFDLASLTKPIATATSIMILLERGKVRLTDKIVDHIPEFAPNGKDQITIEQLLLHTSGLIADNPLSDFDAGPEKAFERINQLKPVTAPGTKFTYSDVNYIMLGKLVEHLSGEPLDVFSRKNIFEPLGLRETTFKPGEALARRSAHRKARRPLDAGRSPRSAFLQTGRRRRACGAVFDGGRFGSFRADAFG